MRILLCNLGYLLDRQAFLGGYLPSPVDAVLGDERGERDRLSTFVDVVLEEEPDVVSLLEVDRGSYRTATDGQCRRIRERLEREGRSYSMHVVNKYGPGRAVTQLPLLRNLSAGLLLRETAPVTAHYLDTGMKRLVLESSLPNGATLLLAHLSVRRGSRRAQLDELADLINAVATDGPVVVAGDFNIFGGRGELDPLLDRTGLVPFMPGRTLVGRPLDHLFDASRKVDLFLTTPDLHVKESRIAGPAISDHRPAVLGLRA